MGVESVFSKLYSYMCPRTREKLSEAFFKALVDFLESPENKRERDAFFSKLLENAAFDYELRREFGQLFLREIVNAIYLTITRDPELKEEFKQLLHKAIDRL